MLDPVAEVNTKVQGAEDTYISQATFLMTELLAITGSGPFRIRTPDKPQMDPVPYDDVETSDLCGEVQTAAVDVCVEYMGKKNLGEVGNPVERIISILLDPRRKTLSKQECVNGSPDIKQLAINKLKDVADLFECSAPQQTNNVFAVSASAPAPAPASALLAPAPAPPPAPAPGGDGATGLLAKKPRVLSVMEQRRANRLAAAGSAGAAGNEAESGSGPSITHNVHVLQEELTRYVAEGVELEEDGFSLPGFGGEGAPLSFLKRQARLTRKRLCRISNSSHAFTTGSRPRAAGLSETFLLSLCSSATYSRAWAPSRWSR